MYSISKKIIIVSLITSNFLIGQERLISVLGTKLGIEFGNKFNGRVIGGQNIFTDGKQLFRLSNRGGFASLNSDARLYSETKYFIGAKNLFKYDNSFLSYSKDGRSWTKYPRPSVFAGRQSSKLGKKNSLLVATDFSAYEISAESLTHVSEDFKDQTNIELPPEAYPLHSAHATKDCLGILSSNNGMMYIVDPDHSISELDTNTFKPTGASPLQRIRLYDDRFVGLDYEKGRIQFLDSKFNEFGKIDERLIMGDDGGTPYKFHKNYLYFFKDSKLVKLDIRTGTTYVKNLFIQGMNGSRTAEMQPFPFRPDYFEVVGPSVYVMNRDESCIAAFDSRFFSSTELPAIGNIVWAKGSKFFITGEGKVRRIATFRVTDNDGQKTAYLPLDFEASSGVTCGKMSFNDMYGQIIPPFADNRGKFWSELDSVYCTYKLNNKFYAISKRKSDLSGYHDFVLVSNNLNDGNSWSVLNEAETEKLLADKVEIRGRKVPSVVEKAEFSILNGEKMIYIDNEDGEFVIWGSELFKIESGQPSRVWTNRNGKTFSGSLIKSRGDTAHIRAGSKMFKVPATLLSDDDQDYLRSLPPRSRPLPKIIK